MEASIIRNLNFAARIVVDNLSKIQRIRFRKIKEICMIDKLLLERISLAGIARVMGVSERWVQGYVNHKYQAVPRQVVVKKN